MTMSPGIGDLVELEDEKDQIMLTIAPDMLGKVDELARRMGPSRAAVIRLAIFRLLEPGG